MTYLNGRKKLGAAIWIGFSPAWSFQMTLNLSSRSIAAVRNFNLQACVNDEYRTFDESGKGDKISDVIIKIKRRTALLMSSGN